MNTNCFEVRVGLIAFLLAPAVGTALNMAYGDRGNEEFDKSYAKYSEFSWVYICAPTYGAGEVMETFFRELNNTSPELVDEAQEAYNNGDCK
jgi:hypothetical protein